MRRSLATRRGDKGATMNQALRSLAFAMTLFALPMASGCMGETGGTGGSGGGTGGTGSGTFAQVQQVFTNNCTTMVACHGGSTATYGFDLTAGVAYRNLVGVDSIKRPG